MHILNGFQGFLPAGFLEIWISGWHMGCLLLLTLVAASAAFTADNVSLLAPVVYGSQVRHLFLQFYIQAERFIYFFSTEVHLLAFLPFTGRCAENLICMKVLTLPAFELLLRRANRMIILLIHAVSLYFCLPASCVSPHLGKAH